MKNIKKIPTRYLVLIVMIITFLVGVGIYSTYAYFSYSLSSNNAVKISAASSIDSTISLDEGHTVGILSGASVTVELNITNSTSSTLYFGCWYEMLSGSSSDVTITSSVSLGNTIATSKTLTTVLTIKNTSSSTVILTVGASGSEENNLNLSSTKNLINSTS